jgi:hypothetical protein
MGDFESIIASSFKRLESVQHVIQDFVHQPSPDRDQHDIAAQSAPLIAVVMRQMTQRSGVQRATVTARQWTATLYVNIRWQRVAAAEAATVLRDGLAHWAEVLWRTVATLIAMVGLLIALAGAFATALLTVILLTLILRPLLMLLTALAAIVRPRGRLQQRRHTDQHDTHGSDQRFWQFHQCVSSGNNSKKGGSAVAGLPLFLQVSP